MRHSWDFCRAQDAYPGRNERRSSNGGRCFFTTALNLFTKMEMLEVIMAFLFSLTVNVMTQ